MVLAQGGGGEGRGHGCDARRERGCGTMGKHGCGTRGKVVVAQVGEHGCGAWMWHKGVNLVVA